MPPKQPSRNPDPVVVLVGCSGLLGKEIKERLAGGSFAGTSVRLFETGGRQGTLTDFAGEAAVAPGVEEDSFEDADIVVLACGPGEAGRLVGYRRKSGSVVIDVSSRSGEPGGPIVNCDVNPKVLEAHRGMVEAPQPVALMLSTLLGRIDQEAGVESAEAVVFEPASGMGEFGQAAMDELYQQTVRLLSFESVPQETFGRQIAFNLVPLSLAPLLGGAGREEASADQARRVLGWEPERLSLRMIVAPVFHCHAALLRVTASRAPSASRILRALRSGGSFDVASPPDRPGDGPATPAEWAGEEKIRVAEIREDPRGASWIWFVADDLKAGAALNVVRIAESLLFGREY